MPCRRSLRASACPTPYNRAPNTQLPANLPSCYLPSTRLPAPSRCAHHRANLALPTSPVPSVPSDPRQPEGRGQQPRRQRPQIQDPAGACGRVDPAGWGVPVPGVWALPSAPWSSRPAALRAAATCLAGEGTSAHVPSPPRAHSGISVPPFATPTELPQAGLLGVLVRWGPGRQGKGQAQAPSCVSERSCCCADQAPPAVRPPALQRCCRRRAATCPV